MAPQNKLSVAETSLSTLGEVKTLLVHTISAAHTRKTLH